ncbi:MAG: tetratricopeptide repeat protein, partial [Acidobacteria bacterium]|nr:tetratricopeptide repeat protein [Acidobacteriota bacterium]
MAINKAKIVEAAQKLVTQGRLKEAIAEYQKILREEPKELNALNTIGDLHVRMNNTPEALRYFTTLADLYVGEGFLVRGIAMYKKISKLDPANVAPSERLAELFTMQGLFTEARAQYLQVAEAYLKNKKAPEAIKILQKVVDLEPDNLQIQQRLAHLYQEHGRKQEAAEIFHHGAERLLHRDKPQEALKWL